MVNNTKTTRIVYMYYTWDIGLDDKKSSPIFRLSYLQLFVKPNLVKKNLYFRPKKLY
jgi:hypothetical protein